MLADTVFQPFASPATGIGLDIVFDFGFWINGMGYTRSSLI